MDTTKDPSDLCLCGHTRLEHVDEEKECSYTMFKGEIPCSCPCHKFRRYSLATDADLKAIPFNNASPYATKNELKASILKTLSAHIADRFNPTRFIPIELVNPLFSEEVTPLPVSVSKWALAFGVRAEFDEIRRAYRFSFIFKATGFVFKSRHEAAEFGARNLEPGNVIPLNDLAPVEDTVRVLRILEYTGPRSAVETQIERSVMGTKTWGRQGREVTLRVATIGSYPEILSRPAQNPLPPQHTICGQCSHAASIWTGHGWLCVCGRTRIDAQKLESGEQKEGE